MKREKNFILMLDNDPGFLCVVEGFLLAYFSHKYCLDIHLYTDAKDALKDVEKAKIVITDYMMGFDCATFVRLATGINPHAKYFMISAFYHQNDPVFIKLGEEFNKISAKFNTEILMMNKSSYMKLCELVVLSLKPREEA